MRFKGAYNIFRGSYALHLINSDKQRNMADFEDAKRKYQGQWLVPVQQLLLRLRPRPRLQLAVAFVVFLMFRIVR